jgi:succinate dehydrogenase hydrophobic anchor subunit
MIKENKAMQQPEIDKQTRQSLSWIGQVVSGVLLIVILLLHMLFQHFQEGLLSANEVIRHVSNPAIFVLELLFIIVVSYHALLGIKAVIFDLKLSDITRRKISVGLTILGIVTIGYGIVLAFLIRSQSLG